MQLNSVIVETKNLTASTVTLVFKVNATIGATDESAAKWSLLVNTRGFGTKMMDMGGSQLPLPVFSADERFVGGEQTPAGLTQGDNWRPTFKGSYQRNDISVPDGDVYVFSCQLVPSVSVNPSQVRSSSLEVDI